jgi:outer membrane protein assembly factor BamB
MHIFFKAPLLHKLVSVGLLSLLGLLAACGTSKEKPQGNLEAIDARLANAIQIQPQWRISLGQLQYLPQFQPRQGLLAISTSMGQVSVLNEQGTTVWGFHIQTPVAAGVGFDGQRAAVVTTNNELIVLEKGKIAWRKSLRGRVATSPLVAGERIFILSLDRAVDAFDAIDGRYLWRYQRTADPLALEFRGVLATHKNTLIVGNGPRMVGLNPVTGTMQWEVGISTPKGIDEIERLAELVGPLAKTSNGLLCARSFQSSVGCVDPEKTSLRWSRNSAGIEAVAVNEQTLVATDTVDRISAWNVQTGQILWVNESLTRWGLSAPIFWNSMVVLGDSRGMLHFLSPSTGKTMNRFNIDSSGINGVPTLFGKNLLVTTNNGNLLALIANQK